MPDVVVGPPLGLAEIHRQDGLRALERLDLRLLVDREDHRVGRRLHVQPDDVPDLVDQLRVGRHLERLGAMRLQPKRPPDAADHRVTHARRLRHRARAPVRLALRRRLQRLDDDGLDRLVGDRPRRADARLVIQPLEPALDKLAAPLRHRRLRRPQAARHGRIRCRRHTPARSARETRRARFTRARFVKRTSAARSSSVTTTSALGRPIFAMPLLDHRSAISPRDFVSRGLERCLPLCR